MTRKNPIIQTVGAAATKAYYGAADDLGAPSRFIYLRGGRPALFHDIRPDALYADAEMGKALLKGHFDFAGQHLDVGQQGDPWNVPSPSERFAHWLHSFVWFEDLLVQNEKTAHLRARFLVDRWISVYGKWNRFAWSPEILPHRLYSWIVNWSPALQIDNLSEPAQLRRTSVLRQLKHLRKTYRRVPEGIPKLKAASALVLGGARMQDSPDALFSRGFDWLDDEIDLQILGDGGHISRNPERAVEALIILQAVDQLLQARGFEASRSLERGIDRLIPILPFYMTTDGGFACFNGGGEGPKTHIKNILKKAKLTGRPFGYSPHTNYQRIEQNGTVLHMDSGAVPISPFDKEAHLAPLAIELATSAGRMIVNCGWNSEQPSHWRRPMRSTAAHSTLVLDNKSAGEIVPQGFRARLLGDCVVKDTGPVKAARKEQVSGIWLEAHHDGYQMETGLSHRRRIFMDNEGKDIRGEDSLFVQIGQTPKSRDEVPFDIRFHLHPDVKVTLAQNLQSALLIQPGNVGWRFRTDAGPLSIQRSVYMGRGHKPIRSEQIVISGNALSDSDGETRSNRVRWSLRRLEPKKTSR